MSKRPFVDERSDHSWSNWHSTKGIGGAVQRFFTPHNLWRDGTQPSRKKFRPGLLALLEIVQSAREKDKRVRAIGSGWSLSNVAFTEDYLVNTARLNSSFRVTRSDMLEPGLVHDDLLVFSQCGVQIKTLNRNLEQARLCLKTAGASNGQTIAGALSTGTHGAANQIGAIQECVVGLHIVGDDGKHYWIERASEPKVSEKFCQKFLVNAVLTRDDALFESALVSFGSFGILHGVLLEASPLFLLDKWVKRFDVADVQGVLNTLDVTALGLPRGHELPYHFEIVINPYRRGHGEEGAFVRIYYKREIAANDPLPVPDLSDGSLMQSEDLVNIVAVLSDAVPDLIPTFLETALKNSVKTTGDSLIPGTPGQHFTDSNPTGGGTSTEIGVPIDRASDALAAIFGVTDQFPFAAPAAVRYVASSRATLAFTHFTPHTCTIEMPGVDSNRSKEGQERVWAALRDAGVPHTFHWGQALPMNPNWVRAGFGDERVDSWLAQRRDFLSPEGRHMFSNQMVDRLALSQVGGP